MADSVPNRASVTLGYKRSLKQYENLDVHITLSSDALSDESEAALMDRVYGLVEEKFLERFAVTEAEIREIQKGK